MLAEIFLVRLETLLRVTASQLDPAASDPRFVPIELPRCLVEPAPGRPGMGSVQQRAA